MINPEILIIPDIHGRDFYKDALSEAVGLGIDVVLIEPGVIKTDFYTRSMNFSKEDTLTEYQEMFGDDMADTIDDAIYKALRMTVDWVDIVRFRYVELSF